MMSQVYYAREQMRQCSSPNALLAAFSGRSVAVCHPTRRGLMESDLETLGRQYMLSLATKAERHCMGSVLIY